MSPKEKIRSLVGKANLEEALKLLVELLPKALPLTQSYNITKYENRMGMLTHDEWLRHRNKISYSILEMLDEVKPTISPIILINQNKLGEAGDVLTELVGDEGIGLSSRLHRLEMRMQNGTISEDNYNVELNQIVEAIKQLLKQHNIEFTTATPADKTEVKMKYPLVIVDSVLSSLKKMKETQVYDLLTCRACNEELCELFGTDPELIAPELMRKSALTLPANEKIELCKSYIDALFTDKETIISAAQEMQNVLNTQVDWKQMITNFQSNPMQKDWEGLASAIDDVIKERRLAGPKIEEWSFIKQDVESIDAGMLWKFRYEQKVASDFKEFAKWLIG